MASPSPPTIFSASRRLASRRRMLALQRRPGAARYLIDDYAGDVLDRLAFLRCEPARALVVGDFPGDLGKALRRRGSEVSLAEPADGFDEERPYRDGPFDLVASLGTLDRVNDLPGALIHIRNALAPGGLMIASFPGAGSLAALRAAMFAADGEGSAPRLHPMIDVRAGGQLLQRAGFADPVIDSRPLDVGYRSLQALVDDLRAQGLSNCLADPGPPLGAWGRDRACNAFADLMRDGRTVERFEILTLSGWRR